MFENIYPCSTVASIFQLFALLGAMRQVVLLYRSKEVSSHTPIYYLSMALSSTFWLAHSGFEIWNPPLILVSSIGMVLSIILTAQVIYYKRAVLGLLVLRLKCAVTTLTCFFR